MFEVVFNLHEMLRQMRETHMICDLILQHED